jgi:acyl-CoA thioesterase-1
MTSVTRPWRPHPALVRFRYRLPHFVADLKQQRKIKIVAIGSSSTAGVDNVVPFPPRLEMLLRSRFFGRQIDVLNRGVGGQEAADELSRFECDVFAEAPSLVIWQVGTNAVYRKEDYNFDDVQHAIAAGLDWLAARRIDVILMDLQYTRAIKDKNGPPDFLANDMERRISVVAGRAKTNVFRRWALMKQWRADGIPIAAMDDGGKLHMSECASRCVASVLDLAIAARVGRISGAPWPPKAETIFC